MRFFTTIYILLLSYIVSALIFWGFSLHKKSVEIYSLDMLRLNARIDSTATPQLYQQEKKKLDKKLDTAKKQYLGEGGTFLLVILLGAGIVYTSIRRSVRLSRQQNNFMLSVTHELKSPIAAMKLNLQTLEKHKLDETKKNLLIERCISESNRLNDLCNNMLIASQIEGRQYRAIKEEIDLGALLADTLRDYAQRYPKRFQAGETGSYMLSGDKLLLQMAINNLLENAVKYTPADTVITAGITRKNNYAVLFVADSGPGIPDAEKKKIFQKFYRIGSEETRRTKGTGLGLYLTSKIITQHKGTLSVKNNTPQGAIFEIALPLS